MAVRAEVHHRWAVTRGNNPDDRPYYCPLHEARYGAAVNLYKRLLQPIPDDATDHWARLADQAVVIPEQDATYWYSYTAIVESTWTLVTPDDDQNTVLANAHTEIAHRPQARIIGDHPATQPTEPVPHDTKIDVRSLWVVTQHGQDPTTRDDDTWYCPVFGPNINTYTQARDLYLSMAEQLRDMPGPPEPTTDLTFWHSLQATTNSPWYTDTQHADPHAFITTLYDKLTNPRKH